MVIRKKRSMCSAVLLTWFPSPLAPQQGQLDVVHACALSGPQLALQLCVVSGIWVDTLNDPYSPGWMGVQDCPPRLLFKGLFHFLKPEGENRRRGTHTLSPTPLFSLVFYLYSESSTAHSSTSQSSCFPTLCPLLSTRISLSLPPTPSHRKVTRRLLLTKVTVLFQLWHRNRSSAAIYGHLHYSSPCNVTESHSCQERKTLGRANVKIIMSSPELKKQSPMNANVMSHETCFTAKFLKSHSYKKKKKKQYL